MALKGNRFTATVCPDGTTLLALDTYSVADLSVPELKRELDAFKRICTLMAAHGKVVTASLKGHFSNISDDQGQVHCPEGMSDDNITECVPFGEEKVR